MHKKLNWGKENKIILMKILWKSYEKPEKCEKSEINWNTRKRLWPLPRPSPQWANWAPSTPPRGGVATARGKENAPTTFSNIFHNFPVQIDKKSFSHLLLRPHILPPFFFPLWHSIARKIILSRHFIFQRM